MNRWVLCTCAFLAIVLACVAIPVVQQVQERRALFAQSGESRIYHDHQAVMDALDVVAPGGVGDDGRLLEFGKLADAVQGKYSQAEMVKLAKYDNPVSAMLGMELIARNGGSDFLVRFLDDGRKVQYRAGCTMNGVKTIGAIVGETWGIDDFRQAHALQLAWFGVVLWSWE